MTEPKATPKRKPATRTRAAAKKPVVSIVAPAATGPDPADPGDAILDAACRQVIATVRLGLKVGRAVPTTHLARRLQLAVDEAALLDGGTP